MASMNTTPSPATLMTLAEVLKITRLGKSSVYALMAEGKFPQQRKIGASSRWLASEVETWVLNLPTTAAKADAQ
jgi:predicted DNA-binding transcriptional regulator AlpA